MEKRRMFRVVGHQLTKLAPAGRSSGYRAIYRAAGRQARSTLDDEQAKEMLEREVGNRSDDIRDALELLRKDRAVFVGDRAFRLLDAVVCGGAVQGIAAENAQMFAREDELGRARLVDAFARLAEMEPRLGKLTGAGLGELPDDETSRRREPRVPLRILVGPNAEHPDPLMRSDLALSIASQYLAILADETSSEAKNESYFSAHRKVVVRSS